MATFQAPRLDAEITTRNLSSSGAALQLLLEDNFSMLRSLSSSGAPHQQLLDVAPTAHLAMSSGAERYKCTQMMTSANTEDPWTDSSIVPRLGGYYATPIIQIFQDGRESR
jgi:hypothetical protein